MEIFLQLLVQGLAMGSIYGLLALGFVLLIGAANIISFAQGEFVMVGAYLAYTFGVLWGVPFWATFLLVVATAALLGVAFERGAYRPLRGGDIPTFLVSTLAVAVLMKNLAQQIWGPYPFAFDQPLGRGVWTWGEVTIVPQHLLIIAVTAVLCAMLYAFFFHTRMGKMMRATAQDRGAAQLLGIPVGRVGTVTFVIATALGCLAGLLVAPVFFVTLDMGFIAGLKAFVATIIGGWGSVPGAIAGGLIVGLVEVFATGYLSSVYKDVYAFLALILVLIVLPQGVFGERVAEKA